MQRCIFITKDLARNRHIYIYSKIPKPKNITENEKAQGAMKVTGKKKRKKQTNKII
jgi:phage FluMu protein Com